MAVLVRGDRDVNEIKLKKALGADQLVLATDAAVKEVTGAPVGFAGPVGLKVPIYCDVEVVRAGGLRRRRQRGRRAPDRRQHRARLHADRVRRLPRRRGRRRVRALRRTGTSRPYRGIEVGQVFFLGTKYSKPMGVTFLDADGEEKPARWAATASASRASSRRRSSRTTTRTASSGRCRWRLTRWRCWTCSRTTRHVVATATRIYDELTAAGIEVLYDDRDERAGVKFKDADLIGLPFRIAVGKKGLAEGVVEVKRRDGHGGAQDEDRRGGARGGGRSHGGARLMTARASDPGARARHRRARRPRPARGWTTLLDRLDGRPAFYKVGPRAVRRRGRAGDRAGARARRARLPGPQAARHPGDGGARGRVGGAHRGRAADRAHVGRLRDAVARGRGRGRAR